MSALLLFPGDETEFWKLVGPVWLPVYYLNCDPLSTSYNIVNKVSNK